MFLQRRQQIDQLSDDDTNIKTDRTGSRRRSCYSALRRLLQLTLVDNEPKNIHSSALRYALAATTFQAALSRRVSLKMI